MIAISTRGKVETGDDVVIGGLIIGGSTATKVIVRAIGRRSWEKACRPRSSI